MDAEEARPQSQATFVSDRLAPSQKTFRNFLSFSEEKMTTANALIVHEALAQDDEFSRDIFVEAGKDGIIFYLKPGNSVQIDYDDLPAILQLVTNNVGWTDDEMTNLIDALDNNSVRQSLEANGWLDVNQ